MTEAALGWSESLSSHFVGSKAMGFQAFFLLVMNATLFSIIPPFIRHFEHGYFILAKTIERLKHTIKSLKVSIG